MSDDGHDAASGNTATDTEQAQNSTGKSVMNEAEATSSTQDDSVKLRLESQSQSQSQSQAQGCAKSKQSQASAAAAHHHRHNSDLQSITQRNAQSTTIPAASSTSTRQITPLKAPYSKTKSTPVSRTAASTDTSKDAAMATTKTSSTPATKPTKPTSKPDFPISIPRPLKKLFDRFPLVAYPPNELPMRAPLDRRRLYRSRSRQFEVHGRESLIEEDRHKLYVFTSEKGAEQGWPSFNPGCLKWQAYLRFQGVKFHTVRSNNHASPNGILPFLVPACQRMGNVADAPISSGGLKKWADGQRTDGEILEERNGVGAEDGKGKRGTESILTDARHDAYMSLINLHIRRAWLCNLYLNPPNFTAVAYPRYIQPTSSNTLIQASVSSTLRAAATSELLKQDTSIGSSSNGDIINSVMLFEEADEAFEALAVRLDSNSSKWLSGCESPGLADAALFAYTHLLLDEGMGWADERMVEMVRGRNGRDSLIRHRNRILELFF